MGEGVAGMITVSRHKKSYPKEILYDGKRTSARASIMTPANFQEGVGACVIKQGGVITEKYGTAVQLMDEGDTNLFFHLRLVIDTALQSYRITGFLSVGPICTDDASQGTPAPVLAWLDEKGYKTVTIKKRNNGSFGSFKIAPVAPPVGNFVTLFDDETDDLQHSILWDDPLAFYGPLFSEVSIVTNTIKNLRDCTIYIKPAEDDNLTISWIGAYNPDVHEETLWLLDNAGNQVAEIRIYETEAIGERTIPIKKNQTYKLVVPGYSYRNYAVTFNDTSVWLLEPAKLQFMGSLGATPRFYFKVLANEAATFCIKDYTQGPIDGLYGATLTRLEDGMVIDVTCTPKTWYYQHDSWALPVESGGTQTWKVDFKGVGRSAFWLDGIPNLFTDRSSWYARLDFEDNEVAAGMPNMIPANSIGFVPNLGHYMPYVAIPAYVQPTLARFHAECANIYSFVDAMSNNPNFENVIRQYMSTTMGLKRDYTIFARGGRDAFLDFDTQPDVQPGIDAWVKNMARINDGRPHYVAAADEPNYNYPDFESYRAHYVAMANFIRNHPDYVASGAKIMAAASSRFDHGPNASVPSERKGYDWARMLVEQYPTLVDAIVWHEWTVRGLLNLRQYGKTVELAHTLTNNGARRLAIEQTNTAGGSSVSLYDNNTHFASLWWAAIFIACTRTGKLDDLMWFPISDELSHPKGLLYESQDATPVYSMKPVGLFHEWLAAHLFGCTSSSVYPIEQVRLEIDLVCFSNVKAGVTRQFVMGVNKSPRTYTVYLTAFAWAAPYKLEFWNPDSTASIVTPTYVAGDQYLTFDLPAETIFILSKGY